MPQTYSDATISEYVLVSNVETMMANADPEKLGGNLGQTLFATKNILNTWSSRY